METKEKKKSKSLVWGILAVVLVIIIIVIGVLIANRGKVHYEGVPTYRLGETVEYEGVQITLVGYEEFTENSWATADEGKVFLFPLVEVVNTTDKLYVIYDKEFDCYFKNRELERTDNASEASVGFEEAPTLGNDVVAGEDVRGCIPLEVPEDWDTIEMYYFGSAVDETPSFCLVVEK